MEKEIYLAGGCFWGAEHFLKKISGVTFTQTGFANGNTDSPTYKEVYTDTTGYAETVLVKFDPDILSLSFLIEMYFKAIDPLSVNKQGEDCGTRYRTGIYYSDPADLPTIKYIYDGEEKKAGEPLAVEVLPLKNWWPAEEYHQDYLDKHPDGYCHLPEALFEIAAGARCPMRRVRDFLESNGIAYDIYFHPPLFTIEEALAYWKNIDAVHCKNIFMRNHKGNRHYLVSFECHKELDIHSLEHKLHQGKLSFASPERMQRCLGLRPGSVSVFGLINDIGLTGNDGVCTSDLSSGASVASAAGVASSASTGAAVDPKELFENGHRVKLYLDASLRDAEKISFHPCDNTASVVISQEGLQRFLTLWGGEVEWLEFCD